jgi:hypothetical protein
VPLLWAFSLKKGKNIRWGRKPVDGLKIAVSTEIVYRRQQAAEQMDASREAARERNAHDPHGGWS